MSRPPGFKHTEETKSKMRENHKGFQRPHTAEEKRKTSESLKIRYRNNPSPLIGRRHRDDTKIKMSETRRGNGNSNWKGGLTKLVKGIRRSPEFLQWRKAVLEKDNHTCQDCGSKDNVNAHHIKSLIEHPELIFEVSNGLTLCEICHKRHTSWQRLNGNGRIRCKKQV
ncbi:hypothetical protein LCGC14_0692230 [marine sediment metagenome]|uniref:HNH nuclease domain-containing protein n=1 Tax=marine sediment metagenome TaxID=412755 RepID=A0A0F9TT41_9ZZZZ